MFSDNAEDEKINVVSENSDYGSAPNQDVVTEARHLNRIKSAGD